MNVIFLDVDGVLNCRTRYEDDKKTRGKVIPGTYSKGIMTPDGFTGVEDRFILNLKKIIDAVSDTKVVLTSDVWKSKIGNPNNISPMASYLITRLNRLGVSIFDETDISIGLFKINSKFANIQKWLNSHDVDNYVILEDSVWYGSNDEKYNHLIYVNNWYGLSDKDVTNAIRILREK